MQSIRQYRQFRKNLETQLERDKLKGDPAAAEKSNAASSKLPRDEPPVAATALEGRDPERGEESPGRVLKRASDAESVESKESDSAETETPDIEKKDHADDVATPAEQNRRAQLSRTVSQPASIATQRSFGTQLGLSMTGVDVRDRTTNEGGDKDIQIFVVGYEGEKDPLNPHNWSFWVRLCATMPIAGIGAVVGIASSIDSSALKEAAMEFGVSEVVESLATGLYLAGFGAGALFAGPVSETLGRNPVYITTLTLYMIFIMASGLAPNIGAQLAFRFLAGFFGSTPLTCAGGSIADLWNPLERVFTFPIFANAAFMGPILGPVMGGFIADSSLISWRWTEWITLIISGLVLAIVVLFQPETYPPLLMKWKAKHLRDLTGDSRFVAPIEIRQETFRHRLLHALYRPFILTAREPIIILIALYLTIIYVILFTFLDGYDYIFGEIHGTSVGITGLCFLGIAIGLCISSALVPLIYKWAKEELKRVQDQGGDKLPPEFRLWYAMLGGAIALPVSLFWMGWTSDPDISIWSPLAASVLFGYSILSIFISCYQYIIDSYEIYAASALASVTLIRYLASGGMVVVGIPFYENLGVHYTVTILACLGVAMAPVPYVFYKYGHKIRAHSKYAVTSRLGE